MHYAELPKDDRVSFRIPKALKDQLSKYAAVDRRKLGDYIFLLLSKHAERLETDEDQPLLAAEDQADYSSMLPPPTLRPIGSTKKEPPRKKA